MVFFFKYTTCLKRIERVVCMDYPVNCFVDPSGCFLLHFSFRHSSFLDADRRRVQSSIHLKLCQTQPTNKTYRTTWRSRTRTACWRCGRQDSETLSYQHPAFCDTRSPRQQCSGGKLRTALGDPRSCSALGASRFL